MAQWLERATDNRVVAGSNPTEAARRHTKSRWSLLSGVYARGSKRSHTGGKCGLHNSTWSIMSVHDVDQNNVKVRVGE